MPGPALFRPNNLPASLAGYWKLDTNIVLEEELNGTSASEIFSNNAAHFRGCGKGIINRGANSIYSATFSLLRLGAPTGTLICRIYSATSALSNPVSLIATSTTTLDVSTVSTSKTDYEFVFASNVDLSSYQYFVVMLERSAGGVGDASNHINIYGTGGSTDAFSWQVGKDVSDVYTNTAGDDIYIILKNSATNNLGLDSSGNGIALTNNNTVTGFSQDYWKTGENSAVFTAANSEYLSRAASGSELDSATAITLACFVKLTTGGLTQMLFAKQTGGLGGGNGYVFFVGSLNNLNFYLGTGTATATNALVPGRWYHLCIVLDAANDVANLYVDGNLDQRFTGQTGTLTNTAANFNIGRHDTAASGYLNGTMKDAAVWTRVLTPIEIKSLALGIDLSALAYRPNNVSVAPTHYWKLNELSSGAGAVTRVDSALSGGINLTDNNTIKSGRGYTEGAGALLTAASSEWLSGTGLSVIGTGDISYSCWVNFTAMAAQYSILARGNGASGLHLNINSTSVLGCYFNGVHLTWTWLPKINTWYHLVIKRSGTAVNAYVDGVSLGGSNTSSANISNTDFYIGTDNGHNLAYYPGSVIDVAEWVGYALSNAEIASLACGIPLQQTGLVSYWKLDEASGTRLDALGVNALTDNNTVTQGTGKVSNAADFEADNSESLSIANGSQVGLNPASDMTFLMWLKPESIPNDTGLGGRDFNATGYYFFKASGGVGFNGNYDPAGAPSLATWYHYVGVITGADVSMFTNSAKVATTVTAAIPSATSNTFYLGYIGSLGYFDGLMDEALLAKRWFRDEEIKTIYCKGLAGKELLSSEIILNTGAFFSVL